MLTAAAERPELEEIPFGKRPHRPDDVDEELKISKGRLHNRNAFLSADDSINDIDPADDNDYDYRLIDKATSLAQSILQRQTDCISFTDTSSSDLLFPGHHSLFIYPDRDFDFDIAINNTTFNHLALSNFGLHHWTPELSIDRSHDVVSNDSNDSDLAATVLSSNISKRHSNAIREKMYHLKEDQCVHDLLM